MTTSAIKPLFADTFYFLAWLHNKDDAHQQALSYGRSTRYSFVTTEWVLTEVADGLARRPGRLRFFPLYHFLTTQRSVTIVPFSPHLFQAGIKRYADRPDKEWSLTDCISFIVMEERRLTQALTADHHFTQAGFVALMR